MNYDNNSLISEKRVNRDRIRYYYSPLGIEKYQHINDITGNGDSLIYSYYCTGLAKQRKTANHNSYIYDERGNILSNQEQISNPLKYTGEYYDGETLSYYLRARYYTPSIGRFITEDSYGGKPDDPISLNPYTYCANNPVKMFDPSGHDAIIITASKAAGYQGHETKFSKKRI
jgi:RHS repeat-associated protein